MASANGRFAGNALFACYVSRMNGAKPNAIRGGFKVFYKYMVLRQTRQTAARAALCS